MDPTIRTITEDEFVTYARAIELAFASVPTDEEIARERSMAELDRSYAAFDGSRIVGAASVFTMPMTVPGGETTIGYVTGVGVVPTHRRRGINTALMRRVLEDARDRGEALAVLYASEGGIYGRFGYGLATTNLSIDVENARTAFVRGVEPAGTVRIAEKDEALDAIVAAHDRMRLDRPGMTAMNRVRFEYTVLHAHGPEKEQPTFFALLEDGSGVEGYAIYRVKHEWEGSGPASVVEVLDLQAPGAGAYAALWRFVFDVDLIRRTTAWARPADEPLLAMVQEPRRLNATVRDGLWVRLVDVAGALAARRYAAPGRLVLEVDDAFCPWNAGRHALEVDADGAAAVERTDADPDVRCSVNEVGATYLGAAGFRHLRRAGRVDELRPGTLRTADALFGWDPAPWSPHVF
jgi:predicted acetyltransferase